ncbi:MAG: demethoxyubiquinone hydroxylase family protein, partial [Burkholderiales bacterium]
MLDQAIVEFDRALRAIAGVHHAERPSPASNIAEGDLDASARAHSAALMRVNHVGEVCAQALYQGQAMTARDAHTQASLQRAAR